VHPLKNPPTPLSMRKGKSPNRTMSFSGRNMKIEARKGVKCYFKKTEERGKLYTMEV
jgi:hypothetical protein